MATKNFTVTSADWVEVATGACLVENRHSCYQALCTTALVKPAAGYDAFHIVSHQDIRTFNYGGTHKVWVKAKDKDLTVIVTADVIA